MINHDDFEVHIEPITIAKDGSIYLGVPRYQIVIVHKPTQTPRIIELNSFMQDQINAAKYQLHDMALRDIHGKV